MYNLELKDGMPKYLKYTKEPAECSQIILNYNFSKVIVGIGIIMFQDSFISNEVNNFI